MRARAGMFDQRVTITRPVSTSDAIGGQSVTPATVVANLPARVDWPTGREALEGQTITATVSVLVRIRYRTDITPKMWLTHKGNTFEIQSVLPEQPRRRVLGLLCTAIQATAGATV